MKHPTLCSACFLRYDYKDRIGMVCPASHFDTGKRKEKADLEERKKLVLALKEEE